MALWYLGMLTAPGRWQLACGLTHEEEMNLESGDDTGVVSLETLKSLSALIADHVNPILPTIFRIFESMIWARKKTHSFYLSLYSANPNSDIQKGNESLKRTFD